MSDYPEASYNIDDEIIDIVSTPDTLGGAPRLDGHRIAVYHILSFYRAGYSVKDITGNEIYPHLSDAQVRAALHYAIDYSEAVERSSKPRDTPLIMDVSFNTKRGGPTLSIFARDSNESGAIAQVTLSIDDLPDRYDEQALHAAWAWMHEPPEDDGLETVSSGQDDWVDSTPSDAGESLFESMDDHLNDTKDADDL